MGALFIACVILSIAGLALGSTLIKGIEVDHSRKVYQIPKDHKYRTKLLIWGALVLAILALVTFQVYITRHGVVAAATPAPA